MGPKYRTITALSNCKFPNFWQVENSYAVFTRDTFTWSKLAFLLYCITFLMVKWHLPHVNVSYKPGISDTSYLIFLKITQTCYHFLYSKYCLSLSIFFAQYPNAVQRFHSTKFNNALYRFLLLCTTHSVTFISVLVWFSKTQVH